MSNTLQYSLGLATSGFLGPLKGAQAAVSGLAGTLRGAGGQLAAAAGITGIGAAFAGAISSGIKFNATLEQQTIAFSTLLGSMDAAQERMGMLNKFAAQTPFDLGEVVNANKLLQTLTGGAMATEKGMLLVGDAAATAGRDFSETAMWVGRLYMGLKSGTPVGEATQRLMEMTLISGETQKELNGLAASGAATGNVMAVMEKIFAKTTGAMIAQSETVAGKWSTLKDNFRQGLGLATSPMFEGLRDTLAQLGSYDWAGMGLKVGSVFKGLTTEIQGGHLGELVYLSLASGFEKSVNVFGTLMAGTIATLPALMAEATKSGLNVGVNNMSIGLIEMWRNSTERAFKDVPDSDPVKQAMQRSSKYLGGISKELAGMTTESVGESFKRLSDAVKKSFSGGVMSIVGDNYSNMLHELLKKTGVPPANGIASPGLATASAGSGTASVTKSSRQTSEVNSLERIGGFLFSNQSTSGLDIQRQAVRNTAITNQHLIDIKGLLKQWTPVGVDFRNLA